MLVGRDNAINITDLFEGRLQYRIPRYQRRYIWDETNWRVLWEDISQLLDVIDAGKKTKPHFTGTIVTRPDKNENRQRVAEISEIIDGQQRLTTFQVIFCVILDISASSKYANSGLGSKIKSIIELPEYDIKRRRAWIEENTEDDPKDEFFPYRLVPKGHDKKAFQSLIEGKELNQSNLIIDAHEYFKTKITDYLQKQGSSLENLTEVLAYNFHFIQIDLDSRDEPEKIFESINDTGRALNEFDYLRNHLFLRIRNLDEDRSDELYDLYWDKFEENPYWNNAEKQDHFFRAFLMGKKGPECFESAGKTIKPFDLYRKDSKAISGNLSQIANELEQLSDYADFYEKLDLSTPVSKDSDLKVLGNRMQFYHNLNLPRLDSFILFLKHGLELNDAVLHGVCDILESYIVRRLLCIEHTEDLYAEINIFFSKALEASKFNIRDFVNFLRDSQGPVEQVRKSLDRAWSKDPNLILYILYRIELFRREENPNSYTPLGFKNLTVSERIAYPVQSEDHHIAESIGNITPLTSAALDDWDYCSFKAKKRFLVEEIAVDLILSEEIYDKDGWDTDPAAEIKRRSSDLLSYFNSIWKPDLGKYI